MNNIFKLMVIFTIIFAFVCLIFEPSSKILNFIFLCLIKLRPIWIIFFTILVCFTNKENLFNIILTLSLGMLFFTFFSLLGMLFFPFFALFGSILISAVYSGNICSVNLDSNLFEENLTKIEFQKKSFKDLNLNLDSFKDFNFNSDSFKFKTTKGYNLVDFLSNFWFLDVILNPSKYTYFPSYFQGYIFKSDFNIYWKEVLPHPLGNIPLPKDVPLPFPTEEEVLFLTEPDSKGYINVLTTVPCVKGHLNEVIVSDRLILKLMRLANLSDTLKYHELYKQPEPMSLYIQGMGARKSFKETFDLLYNNPTISESGLNYTKYTVYLKNSNGSEGELIGEVGSSWSDTGYIPSVSYVLSQNYWGNKYGEEFVKTFVEHWWTLPRKDSIIQIPP